MYNLHISKPIARLVCSFATVGLFAMLVACGDTFRPVVIPNTPTGVDPGVQRTAMVLTEGPASNTTAPCAAAAAPPCPGTVMELSVPGDTNSSGFPAPGDQANYVIGRGPVWAAFGITFPQQLLIVNRDSDTVTFFTPSIGNASNLSLPSPQPGGDKPVFVTIVQDPATTNDIAFTANSASNTVSLIDGATKVVRTTVPVGTTPVWIAGIPSQRKMYVVNKGDGTVSVISTSDGSVVHPPIAVGSAPVAVVTNASATTAYVVNSGSGNVSVIDTASDTVTSTIATGAGSNFAIFDPKLLRVYVTNGTANSVTVIDASTGSGGVLRNVSLPAGATKPVGVAALSDGTRFYTVNQATNNVTVFDAQSFAARTTIAVGTNPVFIAASSDSTRVYVANHDATVDTNGNLVQPPGTTIIRAIASPSENPPKAADTVVTTIPATFTDPQTCQQESATCVRTQPTFVISQ